MEVVIKSAAEETAEKPTTNPSNVRTCLPRGSAAEICGALRLLLGDVFSLCLRTSRERVGKFVPAIASHFWTGVTLEWPTQMERDCCSMSRDGGVVALGARHRSDHLDHETEQARWDFEVTPRFTRRELAVG